ncbi:cellulose biosynthesis cyclic di-GMP-binding regulatory protein BcsB [Mucilaginibacter sp. UYCu711]|uniref:cellulose biosynthesis cyclic di-GMP-binding regulatory protein BcsB n=1 Tax=Mucilaginibacter sp. UYCu711 TaxID=3156339 RepID=UPI003D1AC528
MNKFFTALALFFLLSTSSFAQRIVSFHAMGHDDDAIIGMSGSSAYYLKVDPSIELNGSKLVLFVQPSQALLKNLSYINVIINDRPAFSSRLSQDSVMTITLNLSRQDMSSDKFLKIQVKTLCTVTDDKCKDLDNPAMWMKIKSYSYLSLVKSTTNFFTNVNIGNCFETMKAIVYPANPTLHDLKAVAWSYSRLKKADVKNIAVYQEGRVPDSVKNYIVVGNLSTLHADRRAMLKVIPQRGEGLFYLNKAVVRTIDTLTRLVNVKGKLVTVKSLAETDAPSEILFVSGGDDIGYEKTITALGNINILNSTFGDYLIIDKAENKFFKTIDENRSKLSFRQIGGTTNFMSGIGNLKSVYNFKNSDFSFTPKEVEIRVIANYSSLAQGDRGYLNLYLNGMLISSEKLDASGKLNTSVTINRYQHHKYNTLETEFRFYSSGGNCSASFNGFFAEVDVDKSYLESKNPFITSDLSFYQYPETFNAGTTRIVVSKKYAPYASAAMGEIIFELNNNINANNFPEFEYSDSIDPNDLKKNNIIALLSHDDPLMGDFPDAPIRFDRKFRLYNNENNKIVYSLSDSVSNGLAQIFYGRSNNAVLVITATGKNLANAFTAASRSITEQLSTLSSNVAISDVNNNKYLFNISKSSENLEYIDTKSVLTRFWESYNLYILLGMLVLILLSFLYIRAKVQKSTDIFSE